jgi:hypothetical protein
MARPERRSRVAETRLLAAPHSGRFLALVLLLALVVRLVLIAQMGNTYYFADTAEYDASARSILAGHGPGTDIPRAPLFPSEMAFGYLLGGVGNFRAVRIVQLVLGVFVVLQCGRLGMRISGPRVARLALLAAAVAPTFVFTTGLLYPTTLYTLLLLSATIEAWDLARQPTLMRAVVFGLLATLTWLTDQIVMVPVVFLLVWMGASLASRGRRGLLALGMAVLVMLVATGGWVRYNERHYGKSGFFFAKAQYVLYYARHDTSMNRSRAIRDPGEFRPLPLTRLLAREWGYLRAQPFGYASDYLHEYVHFFDPWPDRLQTSNNYTRKEMLWIGALYIAPILVLALLGFFVGAARWRDRALMALVPLATAFVYSFFITQTRYRIPAEPQLLVLAALGLVRLSPRFVTTLTGLGPEVAGSERGRSTP